MRRRPAIHLAFLLFIPVFMVAQSVAYGQSGREILDRLQTQYKSIDAFQASFTQTISSTFSTAEEHFSGTLILSGDRYRVETGGQTIVTDGKVTWIYNEDEHQVLINNYVKDETTFSLNDFLFHFEDVYEIVSVGRALSAGENLDVLRLRPKDADAYFREIMLVMRTRDDLVTRIEVTDVNDSRMTFQLREIKLNPALGPNVFSFTPPSGTEVVDLREE